MRPIATFIVLALLSPVIATADKQPVWLTDYETAQQIAQEKQLPLILFFTGSDWCHWCQKLDSGLFAEPAFTQSVGHSFIAVQIDFPRSKTLPIQQSRRNRSLAHRFDITTFPTVLILDPVSGRILHQHGFIRIDPTHYVHVLSRLLAQNP